MAFIKQKDREKQVKKINQKYGFRKFLVLIDLVLAIVLVVLIFLNAYGLLADNHEPLAGYNENGLTWWGWLVITWINVVIILGIIAIIFIFTFEDPNKTKARIAKLQSSAISGKKINKKESVSKQVKDRAVSSK